MWPDLAASLKEIKRVLRPRGHVVLSWHSATASSSTSRRLATSDNVTGRLTAALQATFGDFLASTAGMDTTPSLPMNRPTRRVPGPGTTCLLITTPPPDVAAYRTAVRPARTNT
jgi:hypothetical protein